MSLLDRQIDSVRNRLALDAFLDAWARALLGAAGAVLAYVAVRQVTAWRLPAEAVVGAAALAITAAAALVLAVRRRPDALFAATAIDRRLNLQEKFSTALHARRLDDAFSRAAVVDAEQTARGTDVRGQFKLHWPRAVVPTLLLAGMAVALLCFVPARNRFASSATAGVSGTAKAKAQDQARQAIRAAIATIDRTPKSVADKADVRLARAELQDLLKRPDLDPAAGHRRAVSAQQQLQKAADDALNTQKFADAKRSAQVLAKLEPDPGEAGPVAEAQRALARGNTDESMQKLQDVARHFDAMPHAEKQQAARQMSTMAEQLGQAAEDPAAAQQADAQLRQLGMTPPQAEQARQLMRKAAAGDAKASQQVRQMAEQAMKPMNDGQGPSPQQVQQAQQTLQRLQARADANHQARQLQQSAAKVAQSMKRSLSPLPGPEAKQADSARPGQNPQQQQQAGKDQQPDTAPPPGQTPARSPADPSAPMQQAMQSMQQQMQQMQSDAKDAQQAANAQQGPPQPGDAKAASNQGRGKGAPDAGDQPGQAGDVRPGQAGGGTQAGRGHTASRTAGGPASPFAVDRQVSSGDTADDGRLLAGSLIKSDAPKGESHARLQNAAKAAEQDAADEVDSERVGKQAQGVVRDYFGSMAGP